MARAVTRAADGERFDKREGAWLRTRRPRKIPEIFLFREGRVR